MGLEAQELDVALIDKNLGDGSGLDVARALKQAKPDVEVILVTGYASLDSAIAAVQIGAYDYVTKPVSDYDALNLKIQNAIDKARMRREQRDLVARLVESETRHRGVFETSSDAFLLVDEATGAIDDANPAAERLYGRGRGGCAALALRRPRLARGASARCRASGARAVPARHRRADGAGFPVELSAGELEVDRAGCASSQSATSPSASAPRSSGASSSRTSARRRRWRRSGGSRAASPTTSRTCSPSSSATPSCSCATCRAGDARLRESAEGIVEAANRAAGVTRQLLTLSRKKLLRPEVLSPNKVVHRPRQAPLARHRRADRPHARSCRTASGRCSPTPTSSRRCS